LSEIYQSSSKINSHKKRKKIELMIRKGLNKKISKREQRIFLLKRGGIERKIKRNEERNLCGNFKLSISYFFELKSNKSFPLN